VTLRVFEQLLSVFTPSPSHSTWTFYRLFWSKFPRIWTEQWNRIMECVNAIFTDFRVSRGITINRHCAQLRFLPSYEIWLDSTIAYNLRTMQLTNPILSTPHQSNLALYQYYNYNIITAYGTKH